MESLLRQRLSGTLPDWPPPEPESNEACVHVFRANEGSTSSAGMRVFGVQL